MGKPVGKAPLDEYDEEALLREMLAEWGASEEQIEQLISVSRSLVLASDRKSKAVDDDEGAAYFPPNPQRS